MKYAKLILTVAFFIHISSYAQNDIKTKRIDNDKEAYEAKVFNKEFNDTKDTINLDQKLYDKIPEKLPDWVFHPYTNNGSFRIVGFSDPNMNKEDAYEQAILRAKALFALFNYSRTSNITDDYTNLVESGKYSLYSTKFQDFSVSRAKVPYNNSIICLLDTFYTKYNEGIALIEFNFSNDTLPNFDTLEVKTEYLQVFIERNFKREKVEFYNFTVTDNLQTDSSNLVADYNYKKVNFGYDISSIYRNKLIEINERTYSYRTNIEFQQDSTDLNNRYFCLSKGLWNGYLTGLLSNFSSESKQLASQVKNSNDFYTLKNQGLIRTVCRNKLTFWLNDFKLIDNQFYISTSASVKE